MHHFSGIAPASTVLRKGDWLAKDASEANFSLAREIQRTESQASRFTFSASEEKLKGDPECTDSVGQCQDFGTASVFPVLIPRIPMYPSGTAEKGVSTDPKNFTDPIAQY